MADAKDEMDHFRAAAAQSFRNSEVAPPIMVGSPPPKAWRPPALDWDRPPWNRWSFQHVCEIVPTATVRRGPETSTLPAPEGGLDAYVFGVEGQAKSFAQMLDDTYTDAVYVWKDGRCLHESYHNGMTPQSRHLLQSVSKSITATAAASLIAEGALDPAAPITDYLPELANTAWAGATLQHVMDMTTGVRFDETYEARDSDAGKMDCASGWKPAPPDMDVTGWPETIWDQILSLKTREADHGERFQYRSIETDVLAHAMERVTGKRLPQILAERLWGPLGCEENADITVDGAGYGLASGGISATLRDVVRFGLGMLGEGYPPLAGVVPEPWIAEVRGGAHGLANADLRRRFANGVYRNQFWIRDNDGPGHYCFGVFGQMVCVLPQFNFVAVKLSTWPVFRDSRLMAETIAAMEAIAADPSL